MIEHPKVGMKVYEKGFEENIFTVYKVDGNHFYVEQDSDNHKFSVPIYNSHQSWYAKEPEMLEPQVGMKIWQDEYESNIWEITGVLPSEIHVKCVEWQDDVYSNDTMYIELDSYHKDGWHIKEGYSPQVPELKTTNPYQTILTNPKYGMKIVHKDDPAKIWVIDYVGITAFYTHKIDGKTITVYKEDYGQYYEISDAPTVVEQVLVDGKAQLKGQKACKGKVTAPLCILKDEKELGKFIPGSILVTMRTTPDFTHIFNQAAGIVTQKGGVLSHAAIVSREYNIPCIVGVTNLLGQVTDGTMATLDADHGFLYVEPIEVKKYVADVVPSYVE